MVSQFSTFTGVESVPPSWTYTFTVCERKNVYGYYDKSVLKLPVNLAY